MCVCIISNNFNKNQQNQKKLLQYCRNMQVLSYPFKLNANIVKLHRSLGIMDIYVKK